MLNRTSDRINEIVSSLPTSKVVKEFTDRLSKGKLTRDENPETHFCVYFAGYDKETKKVFIGHHKKSNLWLFNGGHIDKDETPEEALKREMGEEWGFKVSLESIGEPKLLTIASIDNKNIKCTKHFDTWFFVPLSELKFNPDQSLLEKEFYTTGWKNIKEARNLVTDTTTLEAILEFEKLFI